MEIIADRVNKIYKGNIHAINDVSFELSPGIYGLLGPNGAGKSTLLKMLVSIIKPDSGVISLDGVDIYKHPQRIRSVLGYLPQDFGIYPNLNAIEFLNYIGALKGIDVRKSKRRIAEVLELVNLYNVRKMPLGRYSGGMKQRLGIAQALLNDPRILALDEPTVGLDPEERVNFRNMLVNLSNDCIVLISTHIVSDLESIASKVIIINKGKIIRNLYPGIIMKEMQNRVWETIIDESEYQIIKNQFILCNAFLSYDGIHIRVVSEIQPKGNSRIVQPSLEDAYLSLISSERGKNANA